MTKRVMQQALDALRGSAGPDEIANAREVLREAIEADEVGKLTLECRAWEVTVDNLKGQLAASTK